MASIFRRSKKKNVPYTIQYTDYDGERRTVKGFTDKGLTEQLAAKLESETRLRKMGLIDPVQEQFALKLRSDIAPHLTAFEDSLTDNSPKHVTLTLSRVRRIVEACKFVKLADINSEAVVACLRSLRKTDGIGHRTYNHYVQAINSFCNWCVTSKRLIANPLVGLELLNAETDVRHQRRALTADEASRLIESARSSEISIQCFSGEVRARIYILSYMTGLRRNELASLSARSFSLDATQPTITVEAGSSKHRKKDVLPLHADLVPMIRTWIAGKSPTEKLFPNLGQRRTWLMVKKDLERVGIPYETDDGIADFHAAGRHTHITELVRNGATLPEAQKLARHTDIKMTMKYTHIGLDDQARALAHLPAPALHGRCISGGVDWQRLTADGTKPCAGNEETPEIIRGSVVCCHPLSQGVNMEARGRQLNFS